MNRGRRALAWASIAGSLVLVAAFHASARWSDGYEIRYGTFVPSAGELRFERNLLLIVLPAIVLGAVGLAKLAPRAVETFDRIGFARPRSWPVLFAVLELCLAAAVRFGVLGGMPITDDEHAYDFQARLLMSGRLYAPSLPEAVRSFFDNIFIVNDGHWYGFYFVGHPAVLAVASFLQVRPWIGAIVSSLTVLLAVGLARRIVGERVAIVSAALIVLSPFFVFASATELSEPTSALFMTLFLYAALRIEDEPNAARWWAIAAAAASFGVLVRPQTGVVYPLPMVMRLWFLHRQGRLGSGIAGPGAALAIAAAGASLVLTIDWILTGNPWRTSQTAYFDQGVTWDFAWGIDASVSHVAEGVRELNFWLFGWPLSLAFLPFFRAGERSRNLAVLIALVIVWYALFAVPMVMAVGPVYYTELVVPLAILTASGIEQTLLRVRRRFGDRESIRVLAWVPAVATIASLLTFVPVQIRSLARMTNVTRAPYDLVAAHGVTNAVVFVERLPSRVVAPRSWVGWPRDNAPDLSDDVLYVKDLGERNAILMRYLPGRTPYRLGMSGSEPVLTRLERSVDR